MAATKQKLIIVESPAKAKTIGRYLGKGYKVEASQGHVCDLPKSQLGVDPEKDFEMKYITIRGRGDILSRIRKEAKNASQVYFATDPDREGEAISWHLFHVLGVDEKAPCRIEFNEVTKKAVQNAIKNPRRLDMGRIDAQQARRALDRLVGYKISPLLWAKVKKGHEINAFIPEEYWDITAECCTGEGRKKQEFRCRLATMDGKKAGAANRKEAEQICELIRNDTFSVTDVRSKEKKKMPAPPFTTSSMQQEAGRKLSFTTSRTMQIVQQLYEGVEIEGEGIQGLVTYIRTDSVRISDDAMEAVRAYIPERFGADYLPKEKNEYKGRKNAQDAHEAIRPTNIERTPDSIKGSLTREQYMLYRLIWNRFIASQMSAAVYQTLTAEITGRRIGLRFYGEHKTFAGFTALYEESPDENIDPVEMNLPILKEGQDVKILSIGSDQHFTQPPNRYTEATLVRTLEENGIGRPSTYAPTISTIISRGYVSREKKRLYPTELGIMVTDMMSKFFHNIVDTEFTATMESRLDAVEEGKEDWKQLLREFYPEFEKTLKLAESKIEKIDIKDEISDVKCDQCGAMMVYKMGKFGRFLACPNFPQCRNTKPLLNYIDTPCPKCGKRLLEKVSRKNRKFYGCEGYPECDFVSWDKPVSEKCPECGSFMVEKHNAKGETILLCSNENCRFKSSVIRREEENDE